MWIKVDDGFISHPKVLTAAGLVGRYGLGRVVALWLKGLSYAGRYQTDGFLPNEFVRTSDEIGTVFVTKALLEVGLWERADGGYRIHDYHDYNPRAEKILAARKSNLQRQQTYLAKRLDRQAEKNNASIDGVNNGVNNARPIPIPIPIPIPSIKNVLATPSGAAPPVKAKKPSPASENQPVKALLATHDRLFQARYGEKPGPYSGKDAALASKVIKAQGLERAQALLAVFFAEEDPFFMQTGHAFPAFFACLTKLITMGKRRVNGSSVAQELQIYDCGCGECHLGPDRTVCSKALGQVYKCRVCGQPHQGHDELWCPARQINSDTEFAQRMQKAATA